MPNPQMSSYQSVLAYCMREIKKAKSDNRTSLTLPICILTLCFSRNAPVDERIVAVNNAAYALATFGYKVTMTFERHPELPIYNETPTDEVYHELKIEWNN